jgi:hypothetical protein
MRTLAGSGDLPGAQARTSEAIRVITPQVMVALLCLLGCASACEPPVDLEEYNSVMKIL